jgi:hypothetical protein
VIEVEPNVLVELPLERGGDRCGHRVGACARKLRGDRNRREVDLRQRRDRQQREGHDAEQSERAGEQCGRDRPADEEL